MKAKCLPVSKEAYLYVMRYIFLATLVLPLFSCTNEGKGTDGVNNTDQDWESKKTLSLSEARSLLELPLACIDIEYPNKLGQVVGSINDLASPRDLHPAFYGCFDWHSAVHGHWSLVRLCNEFPELEERDFIIDKLLEHISKENIALEIEYFEREYNGTYERMYGWAWLFKLAVELKQLDHPLQNEISENLQPLVDLLSEKTQTFLPKLHYPIRVGTHTNTAFAMTMIYDYAEVFNDDELKSVVEQCAVDFFKEDCDCPINWEPSGYDFLSPCLEEADIMRRVLGKEEFKTWLDSFLPEIGKPNFSLEPGVVSDRNDGHLVHLDGLNFSRAWCLYGITETIPKYGHLIRMANNHIEHSLPHLAGDSYEGGHWLASFALLSLEH